MTPAEAQTARSSLIKVYCDGIGAVLQATGREHAIIAADASASAGIAALASLCGPQVAIEHAYKIADALPLPDAGSAPAPTLKEARRRAFWTTAFAMIDRTAYVMAGLFIGIWIVLATC